MTPTTPYEDRDSTRASAPGVSMVDGTATPKTSANDTHPRPRVGDPPVTAELVADHGLSPEEYQRVLAVMGRELTFTELGIFSAMWSEHRGHKNSKRLLRLLPNEAPWVIRGPGENAGVIDIGDGYALAFKIESHNHPSAVEPYRGAATGVGGILRDVLSMGARPIGVLDSLRFGDLDSPRARHLFSGVVAGGGDYGNGVGIPNIGGDVAFDRGYDGTAVVNVMCIGLMRKEELIPASASGIGDALMAVGARTGRDGIRGATFASEEQSRDLDEASRPQVQVSEPLTEKPLTEKLLLEASLELIASRVITGIQNMGSAGITSSASEMAGRTGNGVEIDTALVPVREPGMTPYEILLSGSQERMLVVAEKGREDDVRSILEKWELEAAVIGRVTDDGRFRVLEAGTVVADIPVLPLTQGCPTYEREGVESDEVKGLRSVDVSAHAEPEGDLTDLFVKLVGSPNIASRRWIDHQYDTSARTATVVRPGGDAGVVRIRDTRLAVAATTDCNGRFVYLDPRRGTLAAMAEAARNLACVGALPTAVTSNLNFGNPLKPHVYYQFREAVRAMADACRAFETPATGGNVSFNNETDGRAIYPTPVVGMVGIIEDLDHVTGQAFRNEGDAVVLLGRNTSELGGSEYLYVTAGLVAGAPPEVDLMAERSLQQAVLAMIRAGAIRSAHGCSDGGLACALAVSAIGDGEAPHGLEVDVDDDLPPVAVLFGEAQGRVVVSCPAHRLDEVLARAEDHDVPARRIGTVGAPGGDVRIRVRDASVSMSADGLRDAWINALPSIMDVPQRSEA